MFPFSNFQKGTTAEKELRPQKQLTGRSSLTVTLQILQGCSSSVLSADEAAMLETSTAPAWSFIDPATAQPRTRRRRGPWWGSTHAGVDEAKAQGPGQRQDGGICSLSPGSRTLEEGATPSSLLAFFPEKKYPLWGTKTSLVRRRGLLHLPLFSQAVRSSRAALWTREH